MSTSVTLFGGDTIKNAIANVRSDASPEDWVLVGHHDNSPNQLELVGSGTGGIDELRSRLADNQVQYALLRLTNKIDLSVTVKFAYIYNFAEKLSFVKKGRFGVVKGDATTYFTPYHVTTEIGAPNDLKEDVIRDLIEDAAGNANHVRDAGFVEGRQERGYTARMQTQNESLGVFNSPTTQNPQLYATRTSNLDKMTKEAGKTIDKQQSTSGVNKYGKTVGVVATQNQELQFSDEAKEAIKTVHSDKSATQWVLTGYQDEDSKKQLVLVASGEGSADELKSHLTADKIRYGIVRDTDYIDGHATTKFAFFEFIGSDVGFIKKAKITTHKGAIRKAFEPFHVDFSISAAKEIDQDIVHGKVSYYSGSKSNVC